MQKLDLPAQNLESAPTIAIGEVAFAHLGATIPPERPRLALPGMGSRWCRVAAILFSAAVFVGSTIYVALTFQWGPILVALKEVNLIHLIGYGGLSIMLYWMIRALRWHLLLKQTDTIVPFFDVYMCTAVSLSFSIFTPLQSGEMLKVELLKKYGMIQRYPGYGSFLVERALDLVTVLTIAGISLLTALSFLPDRSYAFYLIAASLSFSLIGIYALYKLRFTGRAQQLLDHMKQCIRNVPKLVLVTFITWVSWASVAFSWYILLYCGSMPLDFLKTVALMSTVTLLSILSLVPGGLGISEAGTSQVLIWLGFASTAAQTGTLLLRSYSIIAIGLGVAHLALWKMVRKLRSRRSAGAASATIPAEADTAGAD
ncbi:MAG: lysylphosphatidylglycerol synthase transmembrane domain-containing protein [Syntrophobacteraceae bacterium]